MQEELFQEATANQIEAKLIENLDNETHQHVDSMQRSMEDRGILPEQPQIMTTRMESDKEVSSYATADDVTINDVSNSEVIEKKPETCTSGLNQIKLISIKVCNGY